MRSVTALGTELLGEVRSLGEGTIGVAVGMVVAGLKDPLVGVFPQQEEVEIRLWCEHHHREKHGRLWLRSRGAHPWGGWRSWRG